MEQVEDKRDSQGLGMKASEVALASCCSETIEIHARNNPMMVCPVCKKIIKCFPDERGQRNYITFCQSRNRDFVSTKYDDFFIVTFKNYDSFGS